MGDATISKLKVFHVISGDLWAGAESMAYNLLDHLKKYPDLDLVIILLNEGRLAEELRAIGVTVHVVDEKQLSFWEIVQRCREILRTHPPDLIHSHRYKENLLALLVRGFNESIQLIATQHGLPECTNSKTTLARRLVSKVNFQLLSRWFARIVAVSTDVGSHLVKQYAFREDRIESIHNGIKIPETAFHKPEAGPFVIGSSGRLFPVKDYPLMVNVAREIAITNENDVRFELAGEGPERPALESMVEIYGLQDHFVLRGHQNDMDTFYRGIDLYLNTSIHEGIPLTILEALARGIPVIAPAVGGINEIITDGVDGFLVKSRNPADFAQKCLLLWENKALRSKMSAAARDKANNTFSAERMAERYYQLYCCTRSPAGHC